MFIHYRTQGFIFKKENRGESDQLFKIYTKDFGKIEVLAKGIRKISSKLRPAAEIFYLSEIEFIQGKTGKTLTDTILIDKFSKLRQDLKRLTIARKIGDLLEDFLKEQEPDKKIWKLTLGTFRELNNFLLSIEKCYLLYYYFFWNLVSALGYRPELYYCLLCQKKLKPEKIYFNPEEGGVVCQNCSKKIKKLIEIRTETIKILRLAAEKDFKFFLKIKTAREHLKDLKEISDNYEKFLLGQNK